MYQLNYISFLFYTGENAEKLLQFKRWFWSIVEKMSMTERQDLVSCRFSVEMCRRITDIITVFNCVYLQRLCMWRVKVTEQGNRDWLDFQFWKHEVWILDLLASESVVCVCPHWHVCDGSTVTVSAQSFLSWVTPVSQLCFEIEVSLRISCSPDLLCILRATPVSSL